MRLFIQPHRSKARVRRGGCGGGRGRRGRQHHAGAAAHPAAGANRNLPVAARAGTGAPASSPWHREGNRALMAGSDAFCKQGCK